MSGSSERVSRLGARSASPAKRPASEMEGIEQGTLGPGGMDNPPQAQAAPSRLSAEYDATKTKTEDTTMSGMTPASDEMDVQEADTNSASISSAGTGSTQTVASSSESAPVSAGEAAETRPHASHKEPYTAEEVDAQVAHVHKLCTEKQLDEGDQGVIISTKWLNRVRSRSTTGGSKYSKDVREGKVGPLDNSDIVLEGAYEEILQDKQGTSFIPLKPGLEREQDFEVVSMDAYAYIIGEYGTAQPKPVVRYAHNTNDSGSAPNISYEIYPPVLTIRKVPQDTHQDAVKPKPSGTFFLLKAKKERLEKWGQHSPEDAIHVVTSKSEKVQSFMSRTKEAAGIPRTTKVKVFRLLDSKNAAVDAPDNKVDGVLSPPASPSTSPRRNAPSLTLSAEVFNKMQAGVDLRPVDILDNTANEKYNGSSSLGQFVFEDQTLIFEEQLGGVGGGEFTSDSKPGLKLSLKNTTASAATSGRTSPAPSGIMTRGRTLKSGRTRGTVGLSNLGNTCYMNSALQCIRSVEELAIFFMTKRYKREINNDNPLGHNGRMANAYYSVIDGIYGSSTSGSFSPSEFKRRLGNAQPMFSGWGQQDSQEFLSFLVDALHEDLNRIKKKPYIENPDSDDATVHDPQAIIELGETYRNNHKSRNDSVAMDLFSGFYKNKMECPKCDKVSVTFDPFSLLTVQLPINVKREHTVLFMPIHGQPVRHRLDIDSNAPFKALMEAIASKHPGVDAKRLIMTEVFSHKIYKLFEDTSTLAEDNIQKADHIFFYEVDAVPTNPVLPEKPYAWSENQALKMLPSDPMNSPMSDCFAVPIFHQTKGQKGWDAVMHPLYITVTRQEAKNYDIILKKVLIAVSKLTSRPILKEFSEDKTAEQGVKSRNDKEHDPSSAEDAAGVSDHSNPSEDGYVNVEVSTPATEMTDSQILARGTSAMQIEEHDSAVPEGFMDPDYPLSSALSSHLFEIMVGNDGEDRLHILNAVPRERYLQSMATRVKLPSRRSSIQSSNAGESASNDGSAGQDDEENEQSDSDMPDIVNGHEQPQPIVGESDSEDPIAGGNTFSSSFHNQPRFGRSKKNKGGKRYGKKNKKQNHRGNQKKNDHSTYGNSTMNGFVQQEDSPYYVQLGEGIVLNWKSEAFDALFEGDKNVVDEMRGHRTTRDDGTGADLFPDPELDARRAKMQARQKNGVTLEECFVETGKREVLSEDNAWYCNRCKEMRLAAKTLEIWTLPDILVVHLKRFGGARGSRDKIDVHVNYPINGLDMSDKLGLKEDGKDYIYDLFAVDNHYGGLGGGHYTAMAKNFNDGQWYDYNDSSCSKISNEEKVHSAAAYLLFYRRRSDKPLGPQYLQDLVTEFRAPKDSGNDADDSDSGEGKLGGPTRSQPGSSSALAGVGAGVMSSQGNSGNGGAGQGNNLTSMNEGSSWDFTNLDSYQAEGGLLGRVEDADDFGVDDDAGSTTAQGDGDADSGFQDGNPMPNLTCDEGGWSEGDSATTWNGCSPAGGDHTEGIELDGNADADRVDEIRLGSSSSEHVDGEAGLD